MEAHFDPLHRTIGLPFPFSILNHPVISYEASFYVGMGGDIIATTQQHRCVDMSRAAAFILTSIIFSFLIATDDWVLFTELKYCNKPMGYEIAISAFKFLIRKRLFDKFHFHIFKLYKTTNKPCS